jgi:hypothetical protein
MMWINSADDFINPPELGIAEKESKRLKDGTFVLIPISDQTHGHGTHTWATVWQSYLKQLLDKSAHRGAGDGLVAAKNPVMLSRGAIPAQKHLDLFSSHDFSVEIHRDANDAPLRMTACWVDRTPTNRRTDAPTMVGLAHGFLAGADFLPTARALVVLQDFLAQANRLGRDLDELVVRDEFDGLLQAQHAMRDQSNGFVGRR